MIIFYLYIKNLSVSKLWINNQLISDIYRKYIQVIGKSSLNQTVEAHIVHNVEGDFDISLYNSTLDIINGKYRDLFVWAMSSYEIYIYIPLLIY